MARLSARVGPCSPSTGYLPHPEDDLDRSGGNARSAWAVGIGPSVPDEVSMPAEQRLGLDEQPFLSTRAKEPTQPGEYCPVPWPQRRAGHRSPEHGRFRAEHDDLSR